MYILSKYVEESNMETARFNPVRNSDAILEIRATSKLMIQCRELRLFPRLPAFFADKKGSLWSSKNRTLAWRPRQSGHPDPGRSREAWSHWLGAGEYQADKCFTLRIKTQQTCWRCQSCQARSTRLHPHISLEQSYHRAAFSFRGNRQKTNSWSLLGCFGNDQINENQFLPPRSSKRKGTKWPKP